MKDIFSDLKNSSDLFDKYCSRVRRGKSTAVFGVSEAVKCALIGGTEEEVAFIVADTDTAERYAREIRSCGKKVAVIYPPEDSLIKNVAFGRELKHKEINGLYNARGADVIILPVVALYRYFPVKIEEIVLKKGENYDLAFLISELVRLGYVRRETAQSRGTFAARGDVIEIFPINYDETVVADFFGDTLDSIKTVNADRRATGRIESVNIVQATETILAANDCEYILSVLEKHLKSRTDAGALCDYVALMREELRDKNTDRFSDFAFLTGAAKPLFELIRPRAVIIDEPKRLKEISDADYKAFTERVDALIKDGAAFPCEKEKVLSAETAFNKTEGLSLSALQAITSAVPFFTPNELLNADVGVVPSYGRDINQLVRDVAEWNKNGYQVKIFAGTIKNASVIKSALSAANIGYGENYFSPGVCVLLDDIKRGFIIRDCKKVFIGSDDTLFKKSVAVAKKTRVAYFNAPEAGDYCVHETRGVGRVIGNKKITTVEGTQEYIAVQYADGQLFVPVEQMDLLTRYLGGNKNPALSRIGGGDFAKVKERVKESIKKLSFDLKKLYGERSGRKGFCFSKDEEMFDLFLKAFPYEDTEDQQSATRDVIDDMTSDKVMDRLICGDVGFGKTEVAFRAVFLAALNGKQSVMLAPTTVLCEQHYNTAIKRFAGFGVKVDCLNRFRTKKQQDEIIERLKKGETDLIIGTHRLLGKDVEFKDLGLLVLDEEQRFGVEHKEKIKLLKSNVDAITLSATPIPRTLHMALTGIRGISTINTPPKKRTPVQTFVCEESDALIKDAVKREMLRDGQTFILYNRVEGINAFALKVKTLLPDATITVIHGQMEERELERNILTFYRGESQVLISTTIIENGVDLPRANTIIVYDADRLGLSTLYQLKGRVGRSDRTAYAYFTFKKDKVLTQNSYDRLSAIIEFTEMGSGIKIAMRDLEIRGAGNVLGAQQHGHMDKIGYELYAKLLKEEFTGEKESIVDLDVRVSAFIPENYIESKSRRMDCYKDIAEIKSEKDAKKLADTLIANYGALPPETVNLITVAVCKKAAASLGAEKICVAKNGCYITFSDFTAFKNPAFSKALDIFSGDVTIKMSDRPTVEFLNSGENNREMLAKVRDFLLTAVKMPNKDK